MPLLASKYFGDVPYSDADIYSFPDGLPGYESEKTFVIIDLPDKRPLVFLQSAAQSSLCFLAFPVLVADPNYELCVSFEDLARLDLALGRQPVIGQEVFVLALLAVPAGGRATANLMAPVVINLRNRTGLQAIRADRKYSHRHSIEGLGGSSSC